MFRIPCLNILTNKSHLVGRAPTPDFGSSVCFSLIAVALVASLSAGNARAQSAQEIIEEVIQRDLERKGSVDNYIVNQSTLGQSVILYYEKVAGDPNSGQSFPTFRMVPPNEIAQRQNNGNVTLSPADMEAYARGLEMTGDALSREMANSGVPMSSLVLPGSYDEPWASPDPRVMNGSLAMFMRAAADAERQSANEDTSVAGNAEQMNQMIDDAELIGIETVEGRSAFHIQSSGVNYPQGTDNGGQFTVDTVSLWIDRDQYVPLRVRMDGIANIEGQDQEMFIEMLSLDYQQIGPLFEPTRQVMRMGGMLTPEQEAQMAEAQAQMAEMEKQLAALSGPERTMMENMLGPQMEMMRNMVNNGTIEVHTLIERIRVNAGLPDQTELATTLFGGQSGFPAGGANFGAGSSALAVAPAAPSPADIAAAQAAQQECLQEKIEAARENQPRRRGLGGLLGGVGRAVSQLGNLDIAGIASSLYEPGASDEDIEERARELGLTDEDIAECRAPQVPEAAPALDF